MAPRIEIHYCPGCGWLARAAWMAQELLGTFQRDLGEVALLPGEPGIFEIRLDGNRLHSREHDGGFPEPRIIKQAIRDRIDPGRSLGHSDRG